MDKEFFLRHIKQKKDIYGETFKYSRCLDINNNINVFGVSNTPVKVGQKVRVKGRVEAYQGEFEIQISDESADLEIIDENIKKLYNVNII